MAVTIYDIAKEVNTSAVTVSLALRDSKRVSRVTKQKIKQAAKDLDYEPNRLARALVGGKTKTIAFVFNYPSIKLANDFSFTEIFNFVAHAASTHGYKLFFHSSTSSRPVDEALKEAVSYGADGVVLVSRIAGERDKEALHNNTVPVVIINRDICSEKTGCLLFDDTEGAKLAAGHLFELGHKRVAFVGKHENESAIRRYEGFKAAAREAGIDQADHLVIESHYDVDSGEEAALQLGKLKQCPTAVMAGGDLLAIGIMSGFRKAGLSVPEDVSVVGYGDEHISKFTYPTLTTVAVNRQNVANVAIGTLLEMISGDSEGQRVVLPTNLVVRDSTVRYTGKN